MTSKSVIKSLLQGELPDELNFGLKPADSIDWEKVKYNTFYKSPQFFESKFPDCMKSLPAFDKIIETIASNTTKSPLEEMLEREKVSDFDPIEVVEK
jgi:hypothetical protein